MLTLWTFPFCFNASCKTCFCWLVVVPDMPFFVVRPQPIYQVTRDHSVTMPCVAEGDPTPSIVWKKVMSASLPLRISLFLLLTYLFINRSTIYTAHITTNV